jgi:hypothetical protein
MFRLQKGCFFTANIYFKRSEKFDAVAYFLFATYAPFVQKPDTYGNCNTNLLAQTPMFSSMALHL